VIGAGIVEVDRLLHHPQTEQTQVKIHVPLRLAGDGGDVVDA
jgi:hypothetical protein